MEEHGVKKDLSLEKPSWLKTPLGRGEVYFKIKKDLRHRKIVTVCEEAKCPNISTCWNTGTATFMILGDTCTRACRFCHIKTGNPQGFVDKNEVFEVADSVFQMKLNYVVLTMVDRDDLPDGGASHIQSVICEIKTKSPEIRIELLSGDFQGDFSLLDSIVSLDLDVFAHNVETVSRLTPRVRDARASYKQSLNVLKYVKEKNPKFYTKSSLMLGLGETFDEVLESLQDLRKIGVDFVTLGQYMRPTKKHLSVKEWVHPSLFEKLKEEAEKMGFLGVASGALVRSSYKANLLFEDSLKKSQI